MQLSDIKQRVDLHTLADRIGLHRPDPNGNYRSPHHKDRSPSLSIYQGGDGVWRWKDFSTDDGGDAFDLVRYVEQCDEHDAIRRVRELFSIASESKQERPAKLSTLDYIAQQCRQSTAEAEAYLVEQRGLSAVVVKRAIQRGALGFSTWTSAQRQSGEVGYGGPAVAFICRDPIESATRGVDYRYLNPELNGGLKTKSQGDKSGVLWTSCWTRLRKAHTVLIAESAINCLSAETAWEKSEGFAALAIRGTNNTDIDWQFLEGKRVLVCMDNDQPIAEGPHKGKRPGQEAAWRVHEELTQHQIPAHMVDQSRWEEINDLNDYLQAKGASATAIALKQHETWLIPGLVGAERREALPEGRPRLYLPPHDFAIYWKFRTRADFTSQIKITQDQDGQEFQSYEDVAGFRIAAMSRITIASAQATMTGDTDTQPKVVFAASVQTPRHGNTLVRRVMTDDALHNVTNWNKFGPVFRPQPFARVVTLWERATFLGERHAANFVGLCYRKGRVTINQGADCYFSDPEKQCPYYNLSFPTGAVSQASRVIEAYQRTMTNNAATTVLCWGLGAHLKVFLGFWPHMVVQADKGAGKTTLIKRLERSLGFTMFSGQSLGTEFRLMTSVSHTSQPVGWEELSARRQDIIDRAVALLQETYQFTVTRRGAELTEFLLSAPVLLAGEDVPVDSLQGKIVRAQLTGRKGDILPDDLPSFPVKEWLQFLSGLERSRVRELYQASLQGLRARSAAAADDDGAARIITNYAALATAWLLLCEFAGIATDQADMPADLTAEMNHHIIESRSTREPWVWIMEIILGEMDRNEFSFPYKFEHREDDTWLLLRPTHCMQHLSQTSALRTKFDALPVKTSRVFARQLVHSGVVVAEGIERAIGGSRVAHLFAISLNQLSQYGLSVSVPEPKEKTS